MIIETTIEVYNRKLDDIGIDLLMPVRLSVDSNEVCAVREHIEKDETEPSSNKCVIYLKSGESFVALISYDFVSDQLKTN